MQMCNKGRREHGTAILERVDDPFQALNFPSDALLLPSKAKKHVVKTL
jgi:hypothetical protein